VTHTSAIFEQIVDQTAEEMKGLPDQCGLGDELILSNSEIIIALVKKLMWFQTIFKFRIFPTDWLISVC